jgi:hypothetical protein
MERQYYVVSWGNIEEDPTQIISVYTNSEAKAHELILNEILNERLNKSVDISKFKDIKDWENIITEVKNKYNVGLSYMLHLKDNK